MSPENPDTTKVESSTNEGTNVDAGQDKSNFNSRGRGFSRGGRFSGPRGGGGSQINRGGNNRGFDSRRGGRGGTGGQGGGGGGSGGMGRGGGMKFERKDSGQEGEQGDGPQGGRDFGGRDFGDRGRFGMRGADDKILDRVQQISGPTYDLPPLAMEEKKFNGRNRMYIGNIASEVTEEDLQELFKPFGETAEIFLNKDKNFGFIKLDYHSNVERAKRELDGTVLKGKNLRIRISPIGTAVKVKNLSPFVSNELLHHAFSVFGEIERATVTVDERGKPTGEGLVEFNRKISAIQCVKKCADSCFFLTGTLRPCIVESYEIIDDSDGYPDKNIPKKSIDYHKEREVGPRFASPGSFEHEYGMRWKQLYELGAQKEDALKKELELEKEKLEAQMEYAKYEHETEMLRDQLRAREMDKERQKREWEMKQRQVEEERMRAEEQMRRTQEEMENRIITQQEELRRRQQENSLFMQAHNLDSLLEQQEESYDKPSGYSSKERADGNIMDPKAFMSSYERHNRYDSRDNARSGGGNMGSSNAGGNSRGHWVSDTRRDDFPINKRRRF